MIWEVYALSDPRDGKVRYVGLTRRGYEWRTRVHINRPSGDGMHDWIKDLKRRKKLPVVSLLERIDSDRSSKPHAAEKRWIKKMVVDGQPLLNINHVKETSAEKYRRDAPKRKIDRARRIVATCERCLAMAKEKVDMLIQQYGDVGSKRSATETAK